METIGIVDDDEDSNLLLAAMLDEKYKVRAFQKWEEAEKAFEKDPPDLILLDISMPGLAGEDVLRQLKRKPGLKNVRVAALTAYALPDDREKFLSEGFDEYIAKPITDYNALFVLMEKLLEK